MVRVAQTRDSKEASMRQFSGFFAVALVAAAVLGVPAVKAEARDKNNLGTGLLLVGTKQDQKPELPKEQYDEKSLSFTADPSAVAYKVKVTFAKASNPDAT